MKTLSPKIILAVLSLLAVVACGKKGGDSPAPVAVTPCATIPQPGYSCVNGQIIPTGVAGSGNLANNVQMQNDSMGLSGMLSFMSTATSVSPTSFDPESYVHVYSGQVAVSGSVQILSQTMCPGMQGVQVIQPGTYVLQGSGMIQRGFVTNLMLTLSGPTQFQILVYKGFIDNPSGLRANSPGNRFQIQSGELAVGNMSCGMFSSY